MKQDAISGRPATPAPLPDPETALRHVSRVIGRAWFRVFEHEAREAREAEEALAQHKETATSPSTSTATVS